MRPFKIETLKFLYAIILHLGLHDSFKLFKRQVTERDIINDCVSPLKYLPIPIQVPLVQHLLDILLLDLPSPLHHIKELRHGNLTVSILVKTLKRSVYNE